MVVADAGMGFQNGEIPQLMLESSFKRLRKSGDEYI